MTRLAIAWALVADALPIYPLYALLFVDAGLSDGQISGLFAIWSATAVVAEVPTGVFADRVSRRTALVSSGLLQAAAFAVWTVAASFPPFALGFVLWGVGGSLASGALEALVYDGLAAKGEQRMYGRVSGWISAAGLIGQLPAAGLAIVTYALGGYALAGWASVALCVVASALALRIPEVGGPRGGEREPDEHPTLLDGLNEALTNRAVGAAIVVVAVVTGLDALEEYFPLLVRDWGLGTQVTPAALLGVVVAGAAGATLGARISRPGWTSGLLLGLAGAALAVAALAAHPGGLVLVALFYGVLQAVQVAADAQLQHRIETSSRATVSSIAALGTEVAVFAVYGAWAAGGAVLSAIAVCAAAAVVICIELRTRSPRARTPTG